jgi:protein-disulfide isomerase
MNEESTISTSKAILYGAVILAIVIVGGFAYQRNFIKNEMPVLVKQAIKDMNPDPSKMSPVTKDDHILGSIDAPVKVVVYTDLECPYCKKFHESFLGLKDNYIKDGKIAFVYRNFPLESLHSKARPEAEATECVAKLGGNDKYWTYVEKIFEATPSNNGLDLNLLPQFATELGIDKTAFTECQKDKTIADKVVAQETNAQDAAAQGTPYALVTYKGEFKGTIGAITLDQYKEMTDSLISGKE